MSSEELAAEMYELRGKNEKLNHYIRYVDARLTVLMEEIWESGNEQVEEIGTKLHEAQEKTKAAYGFVEDAFLVDPMGTSTSGRYKFTLEGLQVQEDYLAKLVNYFIFKLETEGDIDREEKKKDGKSGVDWFSFHSLRGICVSKEEFFLGRRANEYGKEFLDSNAGIYKGIDVKELLQETSELVQERDRILHGNSNVPNNTVKDEDCRGRVYEAFLCDILVFLVLFVGKNECHKEAFQEFGFQLKRRSNKRTRSINKLLNLLEGAKFRLKQMKNLTKLASNVLERFSSARIEERQFVMFLEILLDKIEHLDIILRDGLPPRSVVPSTDEFSISEDVDQRCKETFDLIQTEMDLFHGPYYLWAYEVLRLVNSVSSDLLVNFLM